MTHRIVLCQSCKAPMIFLKGTKRRVPVNAETVTDPNDHTFDRRKGHVAHFATCPDALKFRKPRNPV